MRKLKKIGLCMIVKNEARIIRRCLASALPLIDYILIVDTGSDDNTIREIGDFISENNVEADVIEEKWRDFAYNRSFALARLRERRDIDYALMIDADDQVKYAPSFGLNTLKQQLTADLYNIVTELGGSTYVRPQLISNKKGFSFSGVLHEYLKCDEAFTQDMLERVSVLSIQDSARNQNADKYRRDAETLAKALETETDAFLRSRYTFYLAQSYRDCGAHADAWRAYSARAEQGFWREEVYVSLWNAGQMAELLEHPSAEILDDYLKAFDLCPQRAEALHAAAHYCRLKSRFQTGYLFAKRGVEIEKPREGLFLADWIYRYGMLDEYAVLAYWCGRYRESLEACQEILALPDLPVSEIARISDNAKFARIALSDAGALS
jgi:glycosyltransferase involved in cell wall biosynthesis